MYKSRDTRRFHNPGFKKNDCVKLLQNGEVITSTSDLLNCWSDHFKCLGRSVPDKHVKCSKEKIPQLNTLTLEREDYVFDCEITVEEIEQDLKRLKAKKSRMALCLNISSLAVSHVPNTLIEPLTGMLLFPTLTAFWELVLLGAVSISHFSTFSFRPFLVVYL